MKILEQNTGIGKCVICQNKITTNKEVWFNEACVMYKEKIICGVCLVNLNGASIEAMNIYEKDDNMDSKERMMNDYGVYIDPDTGKIVSKGIREAKA